MRLKRAIAMLAASAVCLGVFAGCGKEETVQQNHKIGLAMSLEDTALSILSNEVASYAESTGTELVKYNAEDDYETQLEQIAQCKADGCEAVIIVQTKNDAESTKAMIEAADGMEVIFANRMPAEECLSDTVLYVGSDESVAGEYQGRYIADELTAQGKLTATGVMIMGNAGLAHTEKRTETAKSTINESGITVDWVLEQDCGYNREQAREAYAAFLKNGGTCDFVICNNDDMALGVIDAMKEDGGKVTCPVIGLDGIEAACQAIVDGDMAFSVYQDLKAQADGSVDVALHLLNGEEITDAEDHVVWIPYAPITAEDAENHLK